MNGSFEMDTPCDIVLQYNIYTPLHIVQGLQVIIYLFLIKNRGLNRI